MIVIHPPGSDGRISGHYFHLFRPYVRLQNKNTKIKAWWVTKYARLLIQFILCIFQNLGFTLNSSKAPMTKSDSPMDMNEVGRHLRRMLKAEEENANIFDWIDVSLIRQVSSMIHWARPSVSPEVNIGD